MLHTDTNDNQTKIKGMADPGRVLDRRALYLQGLKLLWIPVLALILGALLGGLIYRVGRTVSDRGPTYEAESTVYLYFAMEDRQNTYDYYNAATWNTLLFTHPGITEPMEAALPEGMDLAAAQEAVTAELPSDIRVMTIRAHAGEKERAAALGRAVDTALVRFGETAPEFDRIEILQESEPRLILTDDRTRNAAVLGGLLGLIAGAFLLAFYLTGREGIYVPEDGEARYGVRTVAIPAGDAAGNTLAEKVIGEAKETGSATLTLGGTSADVLTNTREAAAFYEQLGDAEVLAGLRRTGVLVALPYGRNCHGALMRLLKTLRSEEIPVKALVLTGADRRFLAKYYGN